MQLITAHYSKEYNIFLFYLSLKCNNLLHPWNIFRLRLTSPRPLIFQPSKPMLITKDKIVPLILYSISVEFPVSLKNTSHFRSKMGRKCHFMLTLKPLRTLHPLERTSHDFWFKPIQFYVTGHWLVHDQPITMKTWPLT